MIFFLGGQWDIFFVDYINKVDVDYTLMSVIRDVLKRFKFPINMQLYFKLPNDTHRLIDSNNIVLEMFGMYRDQSRIVIFVGDIAMSPFNPGMWLDANDEPDGSDCGNVEVHNIEISNPEIDNLQNDDVDDGHFSSDSDSTYIVVSEKSTDYGSDLEYFLDGDTFSDGCGNACKEKYYVNFSTINLGEYAAYVELISDEYTSCMAATKEKKSFKR